MRAKEPREGILSHQTVDPLLSFVECVSARRVHHTQQSLTGLSIQVYLERQKQKIKGALPFILRFVVSSRTPVRLTAVLVSTDLQWGVRADELTVDAAGLGPLHVWRGNPVVLTGQPELKVLITELWTQERSKCLKTNWEKVNWRIVRSSHACWVAGLYVCVLMNRFNPMKNSSTCLCKRKCKYYRSIGLKGKKTTSFKVVYSLSIYNVTTCSGYKITTYLRVKVHVHVYVWILTLNNTFAAY